MKDWKGQGFIEYALIIGLVGIVVAVIVALVLPRMNVTPPSMNAPLLEIVRYCEPLARDSHTQYNFATKNNQTTYTDNAEKFAACLQEYEYVIRR